MIAFLLSMGAQYWVLIPLFLPDATPFLEAIGLLLEILVVVS